MSWKTGIYIDGENVRLSGGYNMRYDALVSLGNVDGYKLLRANFYIAEDKERLEADPEFAAKVMGYYNACRTHGLTIRKKYVKKFHNEDGSISVKANADMQLAMDVIQQSDNLDKVILVTGDGDFVDLVTTLQNKGCRVEVVGFDNVSRVLKEAADRYFSGFCIPGLVPHNNGDERYNRGVVSSFNRERGFGIFNYLRKNTESECIVDKSIFFHCTKYSGPREDFEDHKSIFEFQIMRSKNRKRDLEADKIRLYEGDRYDHKKHP